MRQLPRGGEVAGSPSNPAGQRFTERGSKEGMGPTFLSPASHPRPPSQQVSQIRWHCAHWNFARISTSRPPQTGHAGRSDASPRQAGAGTSATSRRAEVPSPCWSITHLRKRRPGATSARAGWSRARGPMMTALPRFLHGPPLPPPAGEGPTHGHEEHPPLRQASAAEDRRAWQTLPLRRVPHPQPTTGDETGPLVVPEVHRPQGPRRRHPRHATAGLDRSSPDRRRLTASARSRGAFR